MEFLGIKLAGRQIRDHIIDVHYLLLFISCHSLKSYFLQPLYDAIKDLMDAAFDESSCSGLNSNENTVDIVANIFLATCQMASGNCGDDFYQMMIKQLQILSIAISGI
ncbi:uncharacterized protein BT62DRAFT_924337 [Guyanagaster necrorhizus]|uniref:Uncharacterized protein n=1 Tax=Guyanagaster necrorhizus TaxID=856835 RepID=A0A9P8AL82_9AGAR|nr:uncharacterized protein BT62DRAFT_924337 [Guyanagaster necrorhizus MCA 3950]KAG7439953.1 hypothetical protein BT62DRAFT_924337 [Guyanagaster necrorhizus MCA 3950]